MVSLTRLSESVSSYTDLRSSLSSEIDDTDGDLPDMAIHISSARRLVLNNIVQLVEHVLVALEDISDDSRILNLSVPGVLDDLLTTSGYITFIKIMTSVTENWARWNRLITRPILEIAQERLREVERNNLNRIKVDRDQRNMTGEDRIKLERLKYIIICLDVRKLSGIEL